MVSVLGKNVYINANTFTNNVNIVNVDLCNLPWVNNNMYRAFYACQNLSSVKNINNNVNEMSYTFQSCPSLVTAPTIPNSVTTLRDTFYVCTGLINAPTIPNSVTSLLYTFEYCTNLVNAPTIPDSVTYMYGTFFECRKLTNVPNLSNNVGDIGSIFYNCHELVSPPIIPNSVTNMFQSFQNCYNLTGDIYINSENVVNATNCFYGTELIKNVYVPYYQEESTHLYAWDVTGFTFYTISPTPSIGDSVYDGDGNVTIYTVKNVIGNSIELEDQ